MINGNVQAFNWYHNCGNILGIGRDMINLDGLPPYFEACWGTKGANANSGNEFKT